MFSVCKDYVAEQAQDAPLLDQIGQKRNYSDNEGEDGPASKKRRQTHLQLKKIEAPSAKTRIISEATASGSMNAQYTTCYLCDLHFTSEVDLEEHICSLLHHRALETEKGKDFVHECNLCCTKCKGLATYVQHLREDSHKSAAERRKEQAQLQPNARVYSLVRYRDTFMNKPRKQVKAISGGVPSSGYGNTTKNTPESFSSSQPPSRPFQHSTRHTPMRAYHPPFEQRHMPSQYSPVQQRHRPGPHHERHNSMPSTYVSRPPWQEDPPPMGRPDGRWMDSRDYYRDSNPYERSLREGTPWWKMPYKQDQYRYYRKDHEPYSAHHPPACPPNYREGYQFPASKWPEPERSFEPKYSNKDSNNNDALSEREKLKIADLATKDDVRQKKKAELNKQPTVPTPKKPLVTNNPKSKPLQSVNSTEAPMKKQICNGQEQRASEQQSTPSEIYKKFQAVMDAIDQPSTNPASGSTTNISNPSETSVFTDKPSEKAKPAKRSVVIDGKEKMLHRTVTFEGTSESSGLQSKSESSFRARLCESVMTGDLQEDDSTDSDKVVTLKLESPHKKSPLKDSKALPYKSTSSAKSTEAPKSSISSNQKWEKRKTSKEATENPTASTVLSKLDALAKRKQAEIADESSATTSGVSLTSGDSSNSTKNTSKSNGTHQSLTDDEQRKIADMNRKKLNPTPNLSKARSRLSSRQHKTSTSDSDNEKKQTRLANMFLKYGTRQNSSTSPALRSGKKNEKRKLSGPRFGIGLVAADDDKSHHSLDESDLQEIAETIHLVELNAAYGSKRVRSISEGETSSAPPETQPTKRNSLDSSTDSFSQQLLDMSEKEELLHSQDNSIKQSMKKIQTETLQVNTLIEQLLQKKKSLCAELSSLEQKEAEVNRQLEKIRLQRLSLLRGTVANQTTNIPKDPSFDCDSCSHSTPTSSVRHISQGLNSPVPNLSQNQETSPQGPIKLEVGDRPSETPVKGEPPQVTSSFACPPPFPVASTSEYFDANTSAGPRADTRGAPEPSIDDIMRKYLQEASTVRGTPKTKQHIKSEKTNDCEVSSTTNPAEDQQRYSTAQKDHPETPSRNQSKPANQPESGTSRNRRNRISQDPNLAKLDVERPKSNEATWSWVTAHSDAYSSFQDEESDVKCLVLDSLDECSGVHKVHDASIISILATQSGWIVSCSKDKTIKVMNSRTGAVVKQYTLAHVPITAHVTMATDELNEKNVEKVFIYVVYLEDGIEKTLLAESTVYRIHLTINLESELPDCKFRQIKILEYNSSILCVHQSTNSFLYLGARDGRVIVCNHKKVKHVETLDCHSPHSICCLTSGTDGARRILCCGSSDCKISVRDAADGLLLRVFTGHTKTVNSLQLVQNMLYSGSSDRTVLVHNIHTGDLVQKFLGMHGGSIKMLAVHKMAIVTICLDKSTRVLIPEPARVSGSPKPTPGLPLCLNLYQAACRDGQTLQSVPVACIGLQDGRVQLIPFLQLALTSQASNRSKESRSDALVEVVDLDDGLSCLWSGCSSCGFTNADALLSHIRLFHAPDDYPEQLDSCCLWDNCTLYFSAELDTSKDVRSHMEKHVADAVKRSHQT